MKIHVSTKYDVWQGFAYFVVCIVAVLKFLGCVRNGSLRDFKSIPGSYFRLFENFMSWVWKRDFRIYPKALTGLRFTCHECILGCLSFRVTLLDYRLEGSLISANLRMLENYTGHLSVVVYDTSDEFLSINNNEHGIKFKKVMPVLHSL